jgi:tagatose-6-phosphate ketose/aldose isomerase
MPEETLRDYASRASLAGGENRLRDIAGRTAVLGTLAAPDDAERCGQGYGHTLREIVQQPFVWADTALRAMPFVEEFHGAALREQRYRAVVLTGSGSSHYVGELVAPALRNALGMPVVPVAAGDLLTHGAAALPVPGPLLLVSIARSGNSPESIAAVRIAAREGRDISFLHITCNADGRLAQGAAEDPEASRLVLHPLTNDRSLVMTSSFTSMAVAALSLGYVGQTAQYLAQAERLCRAVLQDQSASAAFAAAIDYAACHRAVFLGSGCQYGAAREAALKLTEMTAGAIVSMAETHLGLRHGPMAAIHPDTLLVSLVPPGTRAARYGADLVAELRAKALGAAIVLQESGSVPKLLEGEVRLPLGDAATDEAFAAVESVAFAQWMGFFASRFHGLAPDAPSRSNVISRVVPPFPIYDMPSNAGGPR